MGTKYTAREPIEIDIGGNCLEFLVDLECMVHPGSKRTHDDPGEDESVEILAVGRMWEEIITVDPATGATTKTRKDHGVPSTWFQQIIIDNADHESLLEQAPARDD